ncbi:MAG: hypothetical protein U0841_09995 [Chloroflexia bacterium]
MQVPTPTIVKVVPLTVHGPPTGTEKATASPELAVALSVNAGSP